MPPPHRVVSEAALRLRNAAPQQWEMFITAFGDYTDAAFMACVEAPAEHIMEAKGMALQCRALLRIFAECAVRPAQPPSTPQP